MSHRTVESNERAVALFDRALEGKADFARAYGGLAQAYVQRTDDLRLGLTWLAQAVEAGTKALDLDPSLRDAYLALGRVYRIKGSLSAELQLWQRCAQLDPRDADVSERLGWVLWFTGRPNEALTWLQTTLAQRPDGSWTHFFLGNANLALGDYDEAERMYRKAVELEPGHSSGQAGVIWSQLAAHRDEEARAQLHRFQTGSFDGDRYPLKLADIEYFLGEDANASQHAQDALAEPEERYWPRGFLASTILGAILWPTDRASAEAQLESSEHIDRERVEGGDEGYMPHVDFAAVEAIRGDAHAACRSLRAAIAAGWRYGSLASRDRLFENVCAHEEFLVLLAA